MARSDLQKVAFSSISLHTADAAVLMAVPYRFLLASTMRKQQQDDEMTEEAEQQAEERCFLSPLLQLLRPAAQFQLWTGLRACSTLTRL